MIYLLDTNACVAHLRGSAVSTVSRRLASLAPANAVICSVVRAELIYGAQRSRNSAANLDQVRRFCAQFLSLPFDDAAADAYGQLRATLASTGSLIGPNDLLIASICLSNRVTLVTHNTAEFGRVTGLRIDDWQL
jgi:tRNA(fMet)-specific endonuclease VapC